MRIQRALLLVEVGTADGLRGRLVDDHLAQAEWPSVEVRFGVPPKGRNMSPHDAFDSDVQEQSCRAAFLQFSSTVCPSALVRLDHAHGDCDPVSGNGFVAAYAAAEACTPEVAAQVLALRHEIRGDNSDGLSRRSLSEFSRRIRSLVSPEWSEGQFWAGYLRTLDYESECAEAEARHQPNEALVYVLGPNLAVLLQTHGAYLFYAEGPNCRDAGVRVLPKERGIYYVKGQPWGYGPDISGEYDSGFDVSEAVPATGEHFKLFAASGPEAFAETIAEYDADFDAEPEAAPSV